MGVNVLRRDSTKAKRKTREELAKENEELRSRMKALEDQAGASADQVLAVLLGGGEQDG